VQGVERVVAELDLRQGHDVAVQPQPEGDPDDERLVQRGVDDPVRVAGQQASAGLHHPAELRHVLAQQEAVLAGDQLVQGRPDGAAIGHAGGALPGRGLLHLGERPVDVFEDGLGWRLGLLSHLLQQRASLNVLLGHDPAQVVVCEEVATLALDASQDVVLGEDALLHQLGAKGDQRVVLVQVEGDVGRRGVPVEPGQGMDVEQAGPLLLLHVGRRRHGRGVHVLEVAPVRLEVSEAEPLGVGPEVADAPSVFGRSGDGDAVVGDQYDHRELPDARGVHGLVHVPFRGGPVAHDRHRHRVPEPLHLLAEGMARHLAELHTHGRLHGEDAVFREVNVLDHLAPPTHHVGVARELLTQQIQAEIVESVQRAPRGAQAPGPVMRHQREVLWIHHAVQRQGGRSAVHLFSGPPDRELHLAPGNQADNVLLDDPGAYGHPVGELQLFRGQRGQEVCSPLFPRGALGLVRLRGRRRPRVTHEASVPGGRHNRFGDPVWRAH